MAASTSTTAAGRRWTDCTLSGECARTGVHGANRLAEQSCWKDSSGDCGRAGTRPGPTRSRSKRRNRSIRDPDLPDEFAPRSTLACRARWTAVGVERDAADLERAMAVLRRLKGEVDAYVRTRTSRSLYELRNASVTALLIARHAAENEESVGTHNSWTRARSRRSPRPLMLTDSDIERWLREDVGHHDVTNDVPGTTEGRLVAKASGVVAGLDAATAVFEYLDCAVETSVDSGSAIDAGDVVLRVDGPAQSVLRGERVAVNITGHASGVATKTRAAVDAAESVATDSGSRIAGTRKTTPVLRGVEKRAVVAGGGDTHRLTLSGMVMVKDNHVAEMGLEGAIERFRERKSFATKLEVEVERPKDAPRAAEAGADIVSENVSPAETDVFGLVATSDADALTEASGGITVAHVPAYAETGVDVISMGSLTHSAPSWTSPSGRGRRNAERREAVSSASVRGSFSVAARSSIWNRYSAVASVSAARSNTSGFHEVSIWPSIALRSSSGTRSMVDVSRTLRQLNVDSVRR